jgi:hypothetical protein
VTKVKQLKHDTLQHSQKSSISRNETFRPRGLAAKTQHLHHLPLENPQSLCCFTSLPSPLLLLSADNRLSSRSLAHFLPLGPLPQPDPLRTTFLSGYTLRLGGSLHISPLTCNPIYPDINICVKLIIHLFLLWPLIMFCSMQ